METKFRSVTAIDTQFAENNTVETFQVFSEPIKGNASERRQRAKETHDNAKLIAAAPEMLEALRYVVKYHRENDSGEGELFGLDFVTTCIEAIRKATL